MQILTSVRSKPFCVTSFPLLSLFYFLRHISRVLCLLLLAFTAVFCNQRYLSSYASIPWELISLMDFRSLEKWILSFLLSSFLFLFFVILTITSFSPRIINVRIELYYWSLFRTIMRHTIYFLWSKFQITLIFEANLEVKRFASQYFTCVI